MFEKLKAIEDKFNEINERLMQPEVVNDNSQYTALMKEYKQLEPIIGTLNEYKAVRASYEEAAELLDQGGLDKEFVPKRTALSTACSSDNPLFSDTSRLFKTCSFVCR